MTACSACNCVVSLCCHGSLLWCHNYVYVMWLALLWLCHVMLCYVCHVTCCCHVMFVTWLAVIYDIIIWYQVCHVTCCYDVMFVMWLALLWCHMFMSCDLLLWCHMFTSHDHQMRPGTEDDDDNDLEETIQTCVVRDVRPGSPSPPSSAPTTKPSRPPPPRPRSAPAPKGRLGSEIDPDASLITDYQLITDIRVRECAKNVLIWLKVWEAVYTFRELFNQ